MASRAAKSLQWLLVGLLLGIALRQLRAAALSVPVIDLVEYWSAAHLLVRGENPYSPAQMLALERSAGWNRADPLLMWNPPWALPFVAPLGWSSYRITYLLWLGLNLGIIFACANKLWEQYGGSPEKRYLAWILSLTFVPTLVVLGLGQIGPLILAGLTLFLLWRERRPWLAGAATVLLGIKPQLLYLFWIALLLWVVRERRWRVLGGAMIAFAVATLVPLFFRHSILTDYVAQFHAARLLSNPSPNLGTLLRTWSSPNTNWLQFVPAALGVGWFAWYLKRVRWDWSCGMPLLLVVSIATTSYGWVFDHVTLLPAVFEIATWTRWNDARARMVIFPYVLVNIALAVSIALHATGTAYAWVAPAWLVVYVVAVKTRRTSRNGRTAITSPLQSRVEKS
jgi:hypothetical protein